MSLENENNINGRMVVGLRDVSARVFLIRLIDPVLTIGCQSIIDRNWGKEKFACTPIESSWFVC